MVRNMVDAMEALEILKRFYLAKYGRGGMTATAGEREQQLKTSGILIRSIDPKTKLYTK